MNPPWPALFEARLELQPPDQLVEMSTERRVHGAPGFRVLDLGFKVRGSFGVSGFVRPICSSFGVSVMRDTLSGINAFKEDDHACSSPG